MQALKHAKLEDGQMLLSKHFLDLVEHSTEMVWVQVVYISLEHAEIYLLQVPVGGLTALESVHNKFVGYVGTSDEETKTIIDLRKDCMERGTRVYDELCTEISVLENFNGPIIVTGEAL